MPVNNGWIGKFTPQYSNYTIDLSYPNINSSFNSTATATKGEIYFAKGFANFAYTGLKASYLQSQQTSHFINGISNTSENTENVKKGFENPELILGIQPKIHPKIRLIAEFNYGVSVGDQETEKVELNKYQSTANSGGSDEIVKLGSIFDLTSFILQGGVSYTHKEQRKEWNKSNTNVYLYNGGDSVELIFGFELPYASQLGANIGYGRYFSGEKTNSNESSYSKADNAGYTAGYLSTYLGIKLGPNFLLIPKLMYYQVLEMDSATQLNINDFKVFGAALGTRVDF